MRWIYTLLFLLFLSTSATSQKLTGIWRGYFMQKGEFDQLSGRFVEERYKYEVQINQLRNNSLEGVTYSYRTTIFFGKASFHGIYTRKTKNVLIKEIKMLEVKAEEQTITCAMTCYLDYAKMGKLETLSGTFTSVNVNNNKDCGEGTVYLEKVPTSEFAKEKFPLNRPHNHPTSPATPHKKNNDTARQVNKNHSTKEATSSNKAVKPKPSVKPGTEDFIISRKPSKKGENTIPKSFQRTDTTVLPPPLTFNKGKSEKIITVPRVLKERDNNLMKTIKLNEKEVRIDYYDNGQIDNDTITVYHNNQLVINHGRLSYSPITLHIHLDVTHPIHEIITVAENLGDVPPNTALMVITAGKKRYEVFITSDEKTNAKVILEYTPVETKVH